MARLFVAVWPSEEALASVAALDRPPLRSVRWTGPEQWHVTLRFLGSVEASEAVDALSSMRHPPVSARLGSATGRFGRAVLHVPVDGLESLAAAVVSVTAEVGRPVEDRPFHGHLTLARSRERRGSRELVDLAGAPVTPVAWEVTSVDLVESHLGHGAGAVRDGDVGSAG